MTTLRASSHYLARLADGAPLPSLEARLAAVGRERFRRVDRFTQLALLGSAECTAGVELRSDCGLYLGTGVGPVASNIAVQEQIFQAHLLPKPFHFVNTLGSASGYYVARQLGLAGQNLFVSRRGGALQACLRVASADLALGIVSRALIGIVEESSLPLEHHRRRIELAPGAEIAEGSHWLLLEPDAGAEDGAAGRRGRPFALERFEASAALERSLRELGEAGDTVAFAHDLAAGDRQRFSRAFGAAAVHEPVLPFHDSRDAALVTDWLARGGAGLALVSGDERAGWFVLRLGA